MWKTSLILMAALAIQSTDLVRQIHAAEAEGFKVIANEGSSGSSKTISLAQTHLGWTFQETEALYSITRSTLPALKKGALRDWKRVLNWAKVGRFSAADLFDVNKTDFTWTNKQTGTQVEFFGLDDEQKARGPRRNRLWINEANEGKYSTYRQLAKRTSGTICIDYNPSMQRHWIYDHVLTREDCKWIHSTYKVNVFLEPKEVREIEVEVPVYRLPDGETFTDWALEGPPHKGAILVSGDPYEWAVFGLGQRAAPGESIYRATYESRDFSEWEVYGLDFGFKHPTVLLGAGVRDVAPRPEMHFDQVVFASDLTLDDLAALMEQQGVPKEALIYADGSRPEMIEGLRRLGYNVRPADKGPGSVFAGITFLQKYRLCFTARSEEARAQFDDYRWQTDSADVPTDKPVKLNDDAPDAGRYAAFTHWNRPNLELRP